MSGRLMSPSTYVPTDQLVARVSPGEMILTPGQQQTLFALARDGDGGAKAGDTIHVHVAGNVLTERELVGAIQSGLYRQKRQTGRLHLD